MRDLEGKVAIVTGGTRDIGRSCSIKLAEAGAKVVVNYHSNKAAGEETILAVEKVGGQAILVKGDMTKKADVDNLVEKTVKAFGDNIHVLVNNAGGLVARKKLAEMDESFLNKVMILNFNSTFLATQAVVPHMPRGSAIVNLASLAGRDGGGGGSSAYSASKGAIITFTRSMAKELGPDGIRVNAKMTDTIISSLKAKRVVPLVQSDDPATALKISEALLEGGLDVLEVVLRTDAALDCLEAIAKEFPHAHVGAGTVLSSEQSKEVIRRGASFIVSPGLDPASVDIAKNADIPILPGISTATELQSAWNMGLRTVKLFPASLVGGPKMLKALSSVFRDVNFMPTGGVSPANLKDYLAVEAVLACGGSWLTPKDAIAAGDFAAITKLAKEAIALAKS